MRTGTDPDRGKRHRGRPEPADLKPARRWLEAVLLVAGVLLLAAGGLMAHAQQIMPEVPEPVGAPPQSLLPPVGTDEATDGPPQPGAAEGGADKDTSAAAPEPNRPQARADLGAQSSEAGSPDDSRGQPDAARREGAEIPSRESEARVRPWPIDPDAVRSLTRAPESTRAMDDAQGAQAEPLQGDSAPTPYPSPTLTAEPTPTAEPTAAPEPTATPSPTPFPPAQNPPYRLTIRAIGVDTPVIPVGWTVETKGGVTVTKWEAADYAAGWHMNSRLPGQGGNVVLAGHNNIRGEVFRDLEKLNPGDRIIIYADRRPYVYEVESRFVVPERGQPIEVQRENARWIGEFPEERLTLISCWPYTTYNYRIIVVALPTW